MRECEAKPTVLCFSDSSGHFTPGGLRGSPNPRGAPPGNRGGCRQCSSHFKNKFSFNIYFYLAAPGLSCGM